nr:hypothetical protein [Lachnospiraceae bacterium]
MDKNSQIYVIGLEMENRSAEDIAREAAMRIDSLFERLIKEQKQKEKTDHESSGDT